MQDAGRGGDPVSAAAALHGEPGPAGARLSAAVANLMAAMELLRLQRRSVGLASSTACLGIKRRVLAVQEAVESVSREMKRVEDRAGEALEEEGRRREERRQEALRGCEALMDDHFEKLQFELKSEAEAARAALAQSARRRSRRSFLHQLRRLCRGLEPVEADSEDEEDARATLSRPSPEAQSPSPDQGVSAWPPPPPPPTPRTCCIASHGEACRPRASLPRPFAPDRRARPDLRGGHRLAASGGHGWSGPPARRAAPPPRAHHTPRGRLRRGVLGRGGGGRAGARGGRTRRVGVPGTGCSVAVRAPALRAGSVKLPPPPGAAYRSAPLEQDQGVDFCSWPCTASCPP